MENKILLTLLCLTVSVYGASKTDKSPPLVLVIVVDQFAYHELQKLNAHFTGGIGFMHKNGVVFENAYQPHGAPQTAVGHTSLNTGVLPRYHGIIGNEWINKEGKLVESDDDTPEHAAVFGKDGNLYSYGRSAENIMVDALTDQLMLRNSPQRRHAAVALSLKSHAAIAMAGHLGIPIWMDDATGWFTTSKAFADVVPAWVQKFNRKNRVDLWKEVEWTLAYPEKSAAYNYNNINNYTFAGSWGFKGNAQRIAGTKVPLTKETDGVGDRGCFECLKKLPKANNLLADLAIATLDEFADHQKPDHLLLWVSMSGLDKVGHPFGPESLETIDMLYHVDRDIKRIIDHAHTRYRAENTLVIVTADHGIIPIPELVHKAGYTDARRLLTTNITSEVNARVEKALGHKDLIVDIVSNNVYLNHKIFDALSQTDKRKILKSVKTYLMQQPGIKQVWTKEELYKADFHMDFHELEAFCRNQISPTRSGELYIFVHPYNLLTKDKYGVTHMSPYDYDTHIPLMVYQKGKFQNKRIMDIVWAQQVAPTLAYVLQVPRPSASTYNVLPGLFA